MVHLEEGSNERASKVRAYSVTELGLASCHGSRNQIQPARNQGIVLVASATVLEGS